MGWIARFITSGLGIRLQTETRSSVPHGASLTDAGLNDSYGSFQICSSKMRIGSYKPIWRLWFMIAVIQTTGSWYSQCLTNIHWSERFKLSEMAAWQILNGAQNRYTIIWSGWPRNSRNCSLKNYVFFGLILCYMTWEKPISRGEWLAGCPIYNYWATKSLYVPCPSMHLHRGRQGEQYCHQYLVSQNSVPTRHCWLMNVQHSLGVTHVTSLCVNNNPHCNFSKSTYGSVPLTGTFSCFIIHQFHLMCYRRVDVS